MKELIFNIHRKSKNPMYQQVYQYIRAQILSGKLEKGKKLPSIRKLANQLEVSRNTTQVAYEQLQSEGYIRSENKKGFFVEAIISDETLNFEPIRKQHHETNHTTMKTIDFKIGTVDQENFPLKKWRMITNKIIKDSSMFSYGEKQGDIKLRKALADYLFQSRGVNTSAEQIIIGSSTQHLLLLLSLMLKQDYHYLAVEDPGYNVARELFVLQSFIIDPIPVKERGIQVDFLLKSTSRLLYVTPTHHFPYGVTIPVNERLKLIEWAKKVEGYIIEDDYDSEFRYIHQPIPSLQSLDSNDRVVYLGTFSKALLPSIRVSYMVLPRRLINEYKKILPLLEQTSSSIHQRTLATFMNEGYWYSHLRKMKALYKRKMNLLNKELSKHFKEYVKIKGGSSGIFVIIEVKTKMSEKMLIERAHDHGIIVYPCSKYFSEYLPEYPHIQLGFGDLGEKEIIKGVSQLAKIWF
ncbi:MULTISPECIES: MocR-like pyridoxine biosynthesis transcription factor PdxR [Bacillus cereus group]|uniref:GntR family transcriptional regulator n=1 Tax=Bacillus thuringiensis TaxID=1428 RepID=A0A1C4E5J0_BACTU|nr:MULTISPECIES: PLP-dependent aminotransferase family protein [Bacillus cereus group]MED3025699.1 PLP-dependent aminotransferase family protein [Bacillus wiedmannii]OTY00906.1 GntR family transcriptional regulator [Bacillus thuringiensis serovar wratislaviensis]OUB59165.1 GntR family transcriptional regulator [Bacillus thuringiensis serovar sylvestriensis]TCW43789.1 GntR family transcriptional regulator [Bacillus thuringiensis]TCW44517.1 GntR family transcriptional regulator [Bacillus thuring